MAGRRRHAGGGGKPQAGAAARPAGSSTGGTGPADAEEERAERGGRAPAGGGAAGDWVRALLWAALYPVLVAALCWWRRRRGGTRGVLRAKTGVNRVSYADKAHIVHIGSCVLEGKAGAFAVFYGAGDPRNKAYRLEGEVASAFDAECAALYWVLAHHPRRQRLTVYTANKAAVARLSGGREAWMAGGTALHQHLDDFVALREKTAVYCSKHGVHPQVRRYVGELRATAGEGAPRVYVPGLAPRRDRAEELARLLRFWRRAAAPPEETQQAESGYGGRGRLKRPEPKGHRREATDVVALDCEMVGVGNLGQISALARVAIVNADGNPVYDRFCKPRRPVVDYRTPWSGVRERDLKDAQSFAQVQREVKGLLAGRVVVGHALSNDWDALELTHPHHLVRDTAKYPPLCRRNGKPRKVSGELGRPASGAGARGLTPSKLSRLVAEHLGLLIQSGEHSPYEDAMAALYLYQKYSGPWEDREAKRREGHLRGKRDRLEARSALAAESDAAGDGPRAEGSPSTPRGAALGVGALQM